MTQALPRLDGQWRRVGSDGSTADVSTVNRRRVLARVVASAAVVIVAVALVGVVAAQRLAEAEAITDAAATADLIADAVVQPVLTDALLTGDADAIAALDAVVTEHVVTGAIVRVKIWQPSGLIVYSDEPRLIGVTFDLDDEERDVLTNPQLHAEVSDLDSPENVYERGNGKLLEVYRPVWTPSGQPLLLETYFEYTEVTQRSGQLWRGFAGITLSSVLVLVVLLFPVLLRLLDNLRRAQTQRESLLEHALDASSAERRRIAGGLHDGVVQDLAGTSYSLAGASERANTLGDPALAADLSSAAAIVRSSIGGLRTLLVDIYPPNLASAGLTAALNDLAASLRARDIAVALEVDPDLSLNPEQERLVFRVAQECLHNVAKHANASSVSLRLGRTDSGTGISLDITDNGRGFDAEAKMVSPNNHFGLRVLGDVATEAAADLRLRTSPGEGTSWRLTL